MKCVKSCFLLRERLASLLGYYNKTDLAQVTSIKSPHHSLSFCLTGSVVQVFIFPSLSKLAGVFQSNLKTSEKARQLNLKKMISNRLVRQFLVPAAFSLNNGGG